MMSAAARNLAALLIGALANTAFAPLELWLLWPLALAALLWLIRDCRPRAALLGGWLFGFGHFVAGLYWTVISTHVYGGAPAWLGVSLCLSLSAFLALYPALFAAGLQWLGGIRSPWVLLAAPALWLLSELVRGWFFSGFPWFAGGYVLVGTAFASAAALVGVFGLSAMLLLWAVALLRIIVAAGAQRYLAAAISLLLPLLALLLPAPSSWVAASGAPIKVALIQGNVPQEQKWLAHMRAPTLARYREMSLAATDAQLLIWPEVAVTLPYDAVRDSYLFGLGQQLARREATALVGITIREDGLPYNSVVAIGAQQGRYDKRHLVPFGEYFPIPDWLRPIMDVLGTPYSDLGFGAAQQQAISVAGQRLSISICFEDVFGEEIALDARGAGLLVNMTNDAWFADSTAPHQHLQIARMRALETGRPMLRVANTGITALISGDGELLERTAQFQTVTLATTVQAVTGNTPYMRYTNTPLWWGAALVLLMLTGLRMMTHNNRSRRT